MMQENSKSAQRARLTYPTVVPDVAELTPQQHAFVAGYMEHGNGRRAYAEAFGVNHTQVRMEASRLLRVPVVSSRIAELRAIAAEALNASVAELALQCFEIATTSAADIQPIDVHACRVCASADGKHPAWTDAEEFADACEAWAASLNGPKPLRKPSPAGGFTYYPFAPVNPRCAGCKGVGVQSLRVVATDDLSPGARMLYAGATVLPDGTVRPMFEDKAKYRDMLHKLLGIYAPTKVEGRHAHLHVHKQAPDTRTPMSVDDALALLEQSP